MKILNKNKVEDSITNSELTGEEVIAILIIIGFVIAVILFAIVVIFFLGTVCHWLLSNQPRLVPAD